MESLALEWSIEPDYGTCESLGQEASRYGFSLVSENDSHGVHLLREPCGLDCMQPLLAIKPGRTTGNSGLLGIPGSVSRSPTEI